MEQMKDKIACSALKLFDEHGYHGTALRDVCKQAGCKMPTIYYYFENKEKLFDEVVRVGFDKMAERLQEQLPKGVSHEEYYIAMVKQKKNLSANDKMIYRMAIKTWLGFEDRGESRQKLLEWELDTYVNTYSHCKEMITSEKWAKLIAHMVTEMIQRIVLIEEDVPDTEIEEYIGMVFEVARHSHLT